MARAQPRGLDRLPSRVDTLAVRYGSAAIGRGIMTWTYRADQFLQVYVWKSAVDGSSVTDSLWADPGSLRPRREVRVTADTVIEVTFDEDRLLTRISVAGKDVSSRTVSVRMPVFSSASIESLAATMPLRLNAAAVFATYYAPPSHLELQQTRIRVAAQDAIGGKLLWRVVAGTADGTTTFWVDATTRAVLQSDVQEGSALITFRRYE
jgi:hypothetical protein